MIRARSLCAPILALILTASVLCGAAAKPAPDARAFGRAMDAFTAPLVAADQLHGNLLVARNGKVFFERSYGWANRELRVPITPETRFNIASITKPITSVIVRQLVDEGKLSLEDSLGRWIPGFPSGEKIKVRDLVFHSAGIPHRVTTEKDETQPLTASEVVEFARKSNLQFEPGAKSLYSSAGYSVLARVLELAGGASYAELARTRVFEPLGMKHSSHDNARTVVPGRAASYVPDLEGWQNAPLKDMSFLVGAGSVVSTARDLHAFSQALVTGRMGAGSGASWVRRGRMTLNGSSNGFRAFADWDSATGLVIIFTGNAVNGSADLVKDAVAKIVAGEAVAPAEVPRIVSRRLPDELLRRYEGFYMVQGTQRLEVRARNGALSMAEWTLVPTSDTTFVSLRDWARITVVPGEGGKVERFDWKIGDRVYPCPRVGDLVRP